MQLFNFAALVSLVTLAGPVASAVTSVSAPVVTDSYIDIQIPDSSASKGYAEITVPLEGITKATYSSLVAEAETQLSGTARCISVGSFCTWGYWDCCGSAGCLMTGIVGGVCV